MPGSISRNVAPDGWSLVLGSVLLGTVVDDYREGQLGPPGRPGHSLQTIAEVLTRCEPPHSHGDLDAVAMFAGYLVLDAWVGNQDRHDQNWAALRQASSPGGLRLAASYDHASSLGFNLLDTRRDALLSSGGVASWAQRGRSHRFEHDPARPRTRSRRSSRPLTAPSIWPGIEVVGTGSSSSVPSMGARWRPSGEVAS